jgi:hypothetical protein
MPPTVAHLLNSISEALQPLHKAPPEGAPQVATTLRDAATAITALADKVGPDGALPEGGADVCRAVASALVQLCGATPAPAVAAEGTGTPAVPVAARDPAAKRIVKFELDTYTAMVTTTRAVQDRMWKVSDLLGQQKVAEALTELKGATDMLTNVSTQMGAAAPAAPAEKMVKVAFTPELLVKWLTEQVAEVAKDKPEQAMKRLACIARVVDVAKQSSFEQTEATPVSADIEEAFVGSSLGGARMDLTTGQEQKTNEQQPSDAESGDSAFAANTAQTLGNTVAALVSQHNATQATRQTAFAKRMLGKGSFLWPHDMARDDLYDDERNQPKPEPQDDRW